MKQTCQTCKWWDQKTIQQLDTPKDPLFFHLPVPMAQKFATATEHCGLCRRAAPIMTFPMHPLTYDTEWCGGWKEKKADD